jgi:hypothetical protein
MASGTAAAFIEFYRQGGAFSEGLFKGERHFFDTHASLPGKKDPLGTIFQQVKTVMLAG